MGRPSRVRVTGPLAPHAAGFRRELALQGYTLNSASDQLRLMAHASRWLARRGLGVEELSPARVEEFLADRRAEGYTLWLSSKAMVPLLDYLRGLGVVPTPAAAAPATEAEQLQHHYRAYLVEERGLAAGTVAGYLHVAGLFLTARGHRRRAAPGPADRCGGDRVRAGRVRATFGRLGEVRRVRAAVAAALPLRGRPHRPPARRRGAVGGGLAPGRRSGRFGRVEVARLLASCDRRTTFGRRDYAVLTVLARLGLRAGEVAALALADIDWRAGELVVRGKGRRQERLPLPGDVGEAVAGWLRRGRPRCECVTVFTRVRAPHRRLTSGGVSAIVRAACGRAGLPELNAHRLRHTAATEMLRAGASLTEVGQVLRHASVLTTAIYAKVDRDRLRTLALPWPGTAP